MEIMMKNNVEGKLGEYNTHKTREKQDQKKKSMYIWLDGVEISQSYIVLRKPTDAKRCITMHIVKGQWHIESKLQKN